MLCIKLQRGQTECRLYSSRSLNEKFANSRQHLPFIHYFTGCDTTSDFFSKSKTHFAELCESDAEHQKTCDVFKQRDQSLNNLINAGVRCVLAIYSKKQKETDIHNCRYTCFVRQAACKKTVAKLQHLPPTLDAATQHFKRVYSQVQLCHRNKILASD